MSQFIGKRFINDNFFYYLTTSDGVTTSLPLDTALANCILYNNVNAGIPIDDQCEDIRFTFKIYILKNFFLW